MREVLERFLEVEFGAVVTGGTPMGKLEVQIGDLELSLDFLRPQERQLSLYYAGDWQRRPDAHELIERIGERFNARLAAGKHQHLFAE
jgi:hypothetical protein